MKGDHSGELMEGEWWACSQPERPADYNWTVFQEGCSACRLALIASVFNNPSLFFRPCDFRMVEDPDGYVMFFFYEVLQLFIEE